MYVGLRFAWVWMDELVEGWMCGWLDGWIAGWVGGWRDGLFLLSEPFSVRFLLIRSATTHLRKLSNGYRPSELCPR